MSIYTLKEMAQCIGAFYQGADLPFQGLSIDSRTLKQGECFLCIQGPHFDGHDFIQEAISQGAIAIITDKPCGIDIPQLLVQDTKQALKDLGKIWRLQFNIPIIAITGSCGKTSTRNMIVKILSQVGPVATADSNFNNAYGLPLSLLKIRPEHQFAVFELGTTSPGEIITIVQICEPTIAAILNIQAAHLEELGSIDGVNAEKSDIFLGLRETGIAVINFDEPYQVQWKDKIRTAHRISYSEKQKADVMATHIKSFLEGVEFELHTPIGNGLIRLNLLGEHVVANALGAISCALAAGAQLSDVQEGLAIIDPVKGRMQPIRLKNGTLLINDTYNATFPSVENAIQTLAKYPGKRIFVMTHIVDLGDYVTEYHTQMGLWVKKYNIDYVLLTGDEKRLKTTLFAAGPRASYFENQEDVLERLIPLLDADVTVLIKGANSCKMNQLVDAIVHKVNEVVHE